WRADRARGEDEDAAARPVRGADLDRVGAAGDRCEAEHGRRSGALERAADRPPARSSDLMGLPDPLRRQVPYGLHSWGPAQKPLDPQHRPGGQSASEEQGCTDVVVEIAGAETRTAAPSEMSATAMNARAARRNLILIFLPPCAIARSKSGFVSMIHHTFRIVTQAVPMLAAGRHPAR